MPTTLASITAADVKAYFNFTDSNRDAQINAILPIVSDYITTYCKHDFLSISRTEIVNIENNFQTDFYLKYRPVASITSIVEAGETLVKNTDYKVDLDTGRVSRISTDGGVIFSQSTSWSTEPEDITVVYTAGDALTQDVCMAFYEIAGIYTQINQKVFVNIEGNEIATKYDVIPKAIMDILDRHKHYAYMPV